MIANLKAKAEGLDKKRVYTAALALVVAGAAGHIMQRSAGEPDQSTALVASVPGTAAQTPAAPVVAAAGMAVGKAPIGASPITPEPSPDLAEAIQPQIAHVAVEAIQTAAAQLATIEEAATPAALQEPEIALGEVDLTEIAPREMGFDEPEVTRSASEPILAMQPAVGQSEQDDAPEIVLAEASEFTDPAAEPAPPLVNCDLVFDAAAQPGAFVALSFSAPCNAGEDVNFTHAGLQFSEQLGPEGDLFLDVPALAENAVFTASMEGGQEASAEVLVPDFSDFERVALMWKGATGFQLHALEGGAGYEDPGHIWAEAPGSQQTLRTGEGGFLSVLGSTATGYAADIYSYPAALMDEGDEPVVSVEAQVMENTCGTEIDGQILRTNAGRTPNVQPLSMIVPGCDTVGEYLVLNNLPQDLKLARN